MTRQLDLRFADGRGYPIRIGEGLLGDRDELAALIPDGGVFVVSDRHVIGHHKATLWHRIGDAVIGQSILEPGERHKDLEAWGRTLERMAASGLTRDGCVLALGGGMVCDIAGFAAACYMRGIPVIQAPTSLLAQVDAAVGGKTGVNLRVVGEQLGRNLVGAFHQPSAVFIDVDTLSTLETREYRSGLAEVIKMAVITDQGLLSSLEADPAAVLARRNEVLIPLIHRCCEIKAALVAQDERESMDSGGGRILLNLGHTYAHAMEALMQGELLHGEAVAIGLVQAADLAARVAGGDPALAPRLATLLARFGLPTEPPAALDADALVDAMALDKKRSRRDLRMVLPLAPEQVVVRAFEDLGVVRDGLRARAAEVSA